MRTYPWLTQGSIDFLAHYLKSLSQPRVMEFGAGGSTIWLAAQVRVIITIEHDSTWHKRIQTYLQKHAKKKNWDLIHHSRPYYSLCDKYPKEHFDLVLVDGRDRVDCIRSSRKLLKPGGVMMVDNTERKRYVQQGLEKLMEGWPKTSALQEGPHPYDGFELKGWTTSWWVKPI